MKKIIKTLSIILLVFLFLIAGGFIYLYKHVNPNDFKGKISALVAKNTAREINIKGDIAWTFLPKLGLSIRDITLSNNKQFAFGDFAKIGEANIHIKLLPLLFHNIQVSSLKIKDVNLQLIKNVAGQNNWQDLVIKPSSTKEITTSVAKNQHSPEYNLAKFNIENVIISNATVSWEDRSIGKNIIFQGISFKGKNINFNEPFDFSLSFTFNNNLPNISGQGQISLQGTTQLNFEKHLYSFTPCEITAHVLDQHYLHTYLPFTARFNAVLDLAAQNLSVSDFQSTIGGISFNGNLEGKKLIDAPIFSGKLAIANFNPGAFLSRFLGIINQNTNPKTFTQAAAKVEFQAASKFIKIPHLEINLDDSVIHGDMNFTRFGAKYLGFNFAINNFNLANYTSFKKTPLQNTITATTVKTVVQKLKAIVNTIPRISNDSVDSAIPIAPQNITLDGAIKIDNLLLNKITLRDANITISGTNKNIIIEPFTARLYDGAIEGKANLDLRNCNNPKSTTHFTLNGVSVQLLSKDLANFDKITGNLTMQADFKNLNGHGLFVINNGAWQGIDISYLVNSANALINNKQKPIESQPPETKFEKLTGTFNLNNGVFSNNDLLVEAGHFHATGNGTINLNTQKLDYQFKASSQQDDSSFSVPINISGTLSNPQIHSDLGKMAIKIGESLLRKLKL